MSIRGNMRWVRVLLWALLLANMAVIFALSAQTAEQSTATTDAVLAKPMEVYETVRPETAGETRVYRQIWIIVRKGAHMAEFFTLCMWATGLLLAYGVRFAYPLGAGFAALYAAGDELHQRLVPGREPSVRDWVLDCLGALAGLLVVYLVARCFRKRRKGRRHG